MSEFTIHHHASELLKLLRVSDGDGPEVYADILTKDLTPYVTTQVSSHAARRKIAEATSTPREFLKKYDELKSRNIRELDSLVYLLSCIVQDKQTTKFLEKNAKERLKAKELKGLTTSTSALSLGKELKDLADNSFGSPMTSQEVNELRSRLSVIASSAAQSSTDDLIKALREKHAKKQGAAGLPVNPSWTRERPYLTRDFMLISKAEQPIVAIGTLPLQMQELSVIEDLLFLMMGVEGKYITIKERREKDKTVLFNVDKSLDVSYQELVHRILPICSFYSNICRFIDNGSRFESGLVSHALCAAMRSMIKEYFIFVTQLEHQFRSNQLSLQKMWFYVQQCMKTMEILANIAMLIQRGTLKGGAILTLLHEKTESYIGDSKARDLTLYLAQAACAPYFEILEQWIYKGIIDDPYGEFLVSEHESIQKERVAEDYNDTYWDQHYAIVREKIPVFLERVAEKILRTGKYLNVIRQCGVTVNCPHAVEILYTLKEREYVDHIEKAYDYASRKLLDLLMTEKKLMARLRSIKHYFLLDQGDFFVCFMDLAEDEMRKNADDIVHSRLEALLELALRTSAAVNDPFKDDLRCNLLPYDLITQLFRILSVTHDRNTSQDPTETQISGLEAFSLDYVVKWPLSLILSKKALTKYQMLFRHLFYSKHVERQLCSLWTINKGVKQQGKSTSWFSTALDLRQRMIHFVQNLEYYMMFEVIEPNWQILAENLREVSNIDGVLEQHNDFLDRCLKDCMLTNPELLKVVSKLMMVCVTFSNCIQRYDASTGVGSSSVEGKSILTDHYGEMMNSGDFKRTITNFETNFSRLLIELIDKLSLYSTTDCEHQMMNMVSRLDHNGFYSEKQRKILASKAKRTYMVLETI
ncbi:gamma-tubulin complex component 2-like isoform X2 [Rhopilema esculentum]|uniref:gamma-tubulin complex component 2-like isoform X2 n=1 Tax=Rhopilema esculentum TaxID=499914 RepID=UPI0031DB6F63